MPGAASEVPISTGTPFVSIHSSVIAMATVCPKIFCVLKSRYRRAVVSGIVFGRIRNARGGARRPRLWGSTRCVRLFVPEERGDIEVVLGVEHEALALGLAQEDGLVALD